LTYTQCEFRMDLYHCDHSFHNFSVFNLLFKELIIFEFISLIELNIILQYEVKGNNKK
jgi:hypothetical protein